METTTLQVKGMTCDHCARAVTRALEQVEGVSRAQVDLRASRAVVEHDPVRADVSTLVNAVLDEGYSAEELA